MEIRNQFNTSRHHITNSGQKHLMFVDEAPLTISEMMRRSKLGIPLSVPQIKDDRITINDRFYTEDFDILDYSLRNERRLSDEEKQRIIEDRLSKDKVIQEEKERQRSLDAELTAKSKERE